MTDPEFADATYVEPITPDVLEKVIAKERPDAILPTLGGQTALNAAVALHEAGRAGQVRRRADRRQHRGDPGGRGPARGSRRSSPGSAPRCPPAGSATPWPTARRPPPSSATRWCSGPRSRWAGPGPASRPTPADLRRMAAAGLDASPVTEVLIEESILGWKEFELELMRDRARQRGRGLLDRERRPDGRAHRRLGHGRARDDADRPRVPAHARRGHRRAARGRRGHRRLQHPVRGAPADRPDGRHRDEPAGVAVLARWPPRPPGSRSRRSRRGWPSATRWTRSATTSPARPRPASSPRSTTWWSRCPGSRSRSSPARTRN